MKELFLTSVVAAAAIVMPADADRRIQDLAPESSFLIMGTDSMGDAMESLKSGHLWDIWESDEMQDVAAEHMEELSFQLTMMEEQLGLEPGSLRHPSGSVGAAAYLAMNDELGMDTLGILALVDFENEETVDSLIAAIIEQADAADEGFEVHNVNGVEVYEFPIRAQEMGDVGGDEFGGMDPMAMMEPFFAGLDKMYVCSSGGAILMSTNLNVLTDAMDGLNGADLESIGDTPAYQNALGQIGGGLDFQIVLLIDKAAEVSQLQPMLMMMGPMMSEPLDAMGLTGLKALSMNMDLSPDGAIMEQRMGILIDGEKHGLVGLFDVASGRGDLPGFVTDEAVSYSRFNVEFGGLMDVINDVVDSLAAVAPMGPDPLGEYEPDMKAVFNSLGRDVHWVNVGETPVVAIRATAPDKIEGVVARYAGQMGLEGREFLGHSIYSDDFNPMAIGIGAGYVFLGEPSNVEMALRMAGGDGPSLSESESYQRAMRDLGNDDVVAWGYSDNIAMVEQLLAPGAMPGAPVPPGAAEMAEIMSQYVGPSVWQMRSVDDGFVMVSRTLTKD